MIFNDFQKFSSSRGIARGLSATTGLLFLIVGISDLTAVYMRFRWNTHIHIERRCRYFNDDMRFVGLQCVTAVAYR